MAEEPKATEKSGILQNPPSDSTKSSQSVPTSPVGLNKTTSVRNSCLCSPTTHAGSFRCRLHRVHQSRSMSKLSELAGK